MNIIESFFEVWYVIKQSNCIMNFATPWHESLGSFRLISK